jgi:hypothetical protein
MSLVYAFVILATSFTSHIVPQSNYPAPISSAKIQSPHVSRDNSLDAVYRDLSKSRSVQLQRLAKYAAAGRFPQNIDFPGRLVPCFVDHQDTACAVGHLMRLDGETALVDQIVRSNNHVRIEDVTSGPLIDWIQNSDLTHAECALIQPAYATIEDYRRGREWQDEHARLQAHFDRVEKTLQVQTQRSLGQALIEKLKSDAASDLHSPANDLNHLTSAVKSPERNVRIAAAHLLANFPLDSTPRGSRIAALRPNLADPDLGVAFWSAIAIEKIGAATHRGQASSPPQIELHSLTLPVFLQVLVSDYDDLRLPALIQLANITPESIGTNLQLRIVPEIRRAVVDTCADQDPEIRSCARQVVSAWRWQRTAYESKRMRRHYLADSFDLECLAAETLILGKSFATSSDAVTKLHHPDSRFDSPSTISFFEPRPGAKIPLVTNDLAEAKKNVDENLLAFYKQHMAANEMPHWLIDSTSEDDEGLYFTVGVRYASGEDSYFTTYLVPRPSMISSANLAPHSWLKTVHGSSESAWPASPPSTASLNPDLLLRFGDVARNDLETFTQTSDLCASFLTYYARIVMDREVHESPDLLTWSGRIADLRQYRPRFMEQGGGGDSVYGGGGWDLHRLTMTCDRKSGELKIAVEPIKFAIQPPPDQVVAPEWTTKELKLMGWRALASPDFFGNRLLPPEFHEVATEFDPSAGKYALAKSRSKLYRTWAQDKSLPPPSLMLAILYDHAGNREMAIKSTRFGGSDVGRDPVALADIARWELSVGETESARRHAEAALKLWPQFRPAELVLSRIEEVD